MRRKLATLVSTAGLLCTMTLSAGIVLAGNPSADLDQCANGTVAAPDQTPCQSSGEWVNGNLGSSKAHYNEGDSVPYRMRFTNLTPGANYTVVIKWDTSKSSKHALDYLTTFNRTLGSNSTPDNNANPVIGVNGLALGTYVAKAIPADPQITGFTPIAGEFRLWGAAFTTPPLGPYSYPDGAGFVGDKSAQLAIPFVPNVSNPVLAWGGHIASHVDWGNGNSAVAISGSPFHMSLVGLNGSGGSQDRSLSNDAVTFPGSIIIVKHSDAPGSTAFSFTTSGGLPIVPATFNLTDSSASPPDPQQVLDDNVLGAGITAFGIYKVQESSLASWDLTNRSCTVANGNTGTATNDGANGVSINIKEGETWTCVFTNAPTPAPALSITKTTSTTTYDHVGQIITFSIVAKNEGNVTLAAVTVTDALATLGTCTPANGSSLAPNATMTCSATYTIQQSDLDAGSYKNTACVDDGAGGAASVCADKTVQADQRPHLAIDKVDLGTQKFANVGDVITYSILVTNDGNVTLSVTVTDAMVTNLDCDGAPGTPYFAGPVSLAPTAQLLCSASHTITQADLDAKTFRNTACVDDGAGGATQACDTVDSPGKNQPTILTTDAFVPQDTITLSDLSGVTTGGNLHVVLRIGGDSCTTGILDWEYTWTNAGNNTYNTTAVVGTPQAQPHAISANTDKVVRWCSEYSGDANNAARTLSDHGEVALIDFDPNLGAGFGAGALAMLAYSLWSRRRRERED
jgi:uncharacterized repeat protein (TIGR01451 family)